MAKGTTETSQTTTQKLSDEQQQILDLAMPGIRSYAANTPKRYSGNTVADFTDAQKTGQAMALEGATKQQGVADAAANRENYLLSNDIWKPENNSALQGAIDASVRPITQAYERTTLPNIRGEATTTGNFGGSRQGVAEGIASGDMSRAIGDTASKVANENYQTNINAQLKALGLSPTIQNEQTTAATTTSGVGEVQQALEQAKINQDVSNYNYDQWMPYYSSKDLLSLVSGIPGGSTTTTGTVPKTNTATQSLGSAAAGASLGTAIMPGVGTAVGAGTGALLPFLLS